MKNSDVAILILAAGRSSRLGLPKQLLEYKEKSLLRRAAQTALSIRPLEVVGILGFESDRMKHELDDLPVRLLINAEWKEGIASSIRMGVASLPESVGGVLLMLCDQPFVSSELLSSLIASCSTEKPISATGYGQSAGVPACFSRSIFNELLDLHGDAGAKSIIARIPGRGATIPYPAAGIDIDTLADYKQLVVQKK